MSYNTGSDVIIQVVNKSTGEVEETFDVNAAVLVTVEDDTVDQSYTVEVHSFGLEEEEVCVILETALDAAGIEDQEDVDSAPAEKEKFIC